MLANFVFHFVFAIFTIWLGVSWFFAYQRFLTAKKALIPLLSLEKIILPKHRSLVVQSIKVLEAELQETLQKKVYICFPIQCTQEYKQNPFKTFGLFFTTSTFQENKNLEYNNQLYSISELALKIKEIDKVTKITFTLKDSSNQLTFWNVEIA